MTARSWSRIRLGDVCETASGGTPNRSEKSFYEGSIPWIKSGELVDNSITSATESISEKALLQSSAKIFPPGCLLIAMYGANVGQLGLLDIEAATNQAICAIFPSERVDRNFLFYVLLQRREWLIERSAGGAQPNISQEIVRDLEIPLPTLAEQLAIAQRLSSAFEDMKTANYCNRYQCDLAKDLSLRILAAEFQGLSPICAGPIFPTAVPSGWGYAALTNVARLESGHTPSRRQPTWWGGDVPWLALPDIRKLHGKYAYETIENTNDLGIANSSARMLPVSTVCVSRTASVGYVTILGKPMATSQDFCNWICHPEKLDAEFLMYAFMASQDAMRELSSGAVHKSIYMPAIQSFHVCVPNIDEQRRIARTLRERLAAAESLSAGLKTRLADIERLPQRLLAAAFA